MPANPISALALALDRTGEVIAAVRDDQWASPTPCTEWTVSDLTRHVIAGNDGFATAVSGQPRPPITQAAPCDADLPAAYRAAGAALISAFSEDGALERIVTVGFGTVPGMVALHLRVTELLVHGWDLATATGQPADFPDDLAEAELAFSEAALAELPPDRRPFASPQPVAQNSPAIIRLVAALGRNI